jgi:hypothetical protein
MGGILGFPKNIRNKTDLPGVRPDFTSTRFRISAGGLSFTDGANDRYREGGMPKLLLRLLRFLLLGLVFLCGGLAVVWTAGALYFDLPAPAPLRTVAAIAWTLAAALFGTLLGWRGRVGVLFAFLLILGWWLTLAPRQDRDWQPSVAKLAYATREGDHITVHDIRNFEYRSATDFTPRYETREYDLANLRELDLFINYWGSPLIAHPILSFDFGAQGRICFSIETRVARGQGYSPIAGLYRQYELIYIAADEGDVVRLRTNFKHEDLYLYRLLIPQNEVQSRFLEYIDRLNRLHLRPAWYNEITENCTTSIRSQRPAALREPWDWRMLLNGLADQMLYERHVLAGNLPFAELKARSLIDQRAISAGNSPDFSNLIRAGLPGF